jgi:transcriptional regulator CtsR
MKKSLADRIEQYLKALIEHSADKQIEIQRIELAETFCCVPSQVTYVLATRFGYDHGYNTESRRGGRGYVRIAKCERADHSPDRQNDLFCYVEALQRAGQLSEREVDLIKTIYLFSLHHLPRYNHGDKEKMLQAAVESFLNRA